MTTLHWNGIRDAGKWRFRRLTRRVQKILGVYMKFRLYFVEYHSDIGFWESNGYRLLSIADDGWGEFEHEQEFIAKDIEDAKLRVWSLDEMSSNSSGVFNVYQDKELAFTEEEA